MDTTMTTNIIMTMMRNAAVDMIMNIIITMMGSAAADMTITTIMQTKYLQAGAGRLLRNLQEKALRKCWRAFQHQKITA